MHENAHIISACGLEIGNEFSRVFRVDKWAERQPYSLTSGLLLRQDEPWRHDEVGNV